MNAETFALTIAGVVLPFVQERLAGARVSGLAALVANLLACVIVAAFATLVMGGATDAGSILAKVGGVFILAQLVYEHFLAPTPATT